MSSKPNMSLEQFRTSHGLALTHHATASSPAAARTLLHVGCGHATLTNIPVAGFHTTPWKEFRLDADASVFPDIIGSMTDMAAVRAEFADAIYSSHNIEHLYPHEVPLAMAEFLRVLQREGFLVLTCPDLQSVCALVAEGKLLETAYVSPAGPIAPIDILYGHRPAMAAGNLFMAHRSGFTLPSLCKSLIDAGFKSLYGFRRDQSFDLWVLASKSQRSSEEITQLAQEYLPQPQ